MMLRKKKQRKITLLSQISRDDKSYDIPADQPETDQEIQSDIANRIIRKAIDGLTIPKHGSHQLAVLPEFRRRGLGLELKLAQRDAVLSQGMTDWVTWTFDPLQRVNAIFNLERLGATSQTYIKNAYGELDDDLNIGLTTDRVQVDWDLTSPRVLRAIAKQKQDTISHKNLYILSAPKTDKECNVHIPTYEKYLTLAVDDLAE